MCPSGCGPLYKPGTDLRDTTCPCGFGYFDRSGLFVAGDRVRGGSAVSREAYSSHPHICPVRVDPRNQDGNISGSHGQDTDFRDFFLPEAGVDFEILKIYVARDGPEASAKPATFRGERGYLLHAKQLPTVEYIANIKTDSAKKRLLQQKHQWAPKESDRQAQESRKAGRQTPSEVSAPGKDITHLGRTQMPMSGDRRDPNRTTQTSASEARYTGAYSGAQQQSPLQAQDYRRSATQDPPSPYQSDVPHGHRHHSERPSSLAEQLGQLSVSQDPPRSQHGTLARNPYQQSLFPDNRDAGQRFENYHGSMPAHPTMGPSYAQPRTSEPNVGRAASIDTQETRVPAHDGVSSTELSAMRTQSRRTSTLTPGDPGYAAPHLARTAQTEQAEQAEEHARRDQRPEQTYHGSRGQRTVTTSGTGRSYADPTVVATSRSSRRHRASVVQPPDDETEDQPERPREQRYRR